MIQPKLSRSFRYVALTGAFTASVGCNPASNEYVPPPPPKVTVAHPVSTEITPFLEQYGRTEASEEAEVRARVRGFIERIDFEPGQSVDAGKVLYKIEPDLYEAEVNSAAAAVAASEASIGVANAKVGQARQDLNREVQLKAKQASSQAQYDAAVAAYDAAEASVESAKAEKGSAEAALAQAKLDLGYTEVTAPIGGEITKTLFKLGNLVENGSHLATVVDSSNVFANFSISDRDLLEFMKARKLAEGADEDDDEFKEAQWRGKKVYLRRETDEGFPFEGKLDYIDQSGIQSKTGTLGLRARFDNEDGQLVPGLFVTVRVPASEAVKSLLVPEASLLRSDQGIFVMTVNSENVVARTRVTVGQTLSGWAIILEGLKESDWVVVDGLQRARPTLKVVPEEVAMEADGQLLLRGQGQPSAQPMEPSSDKQAAAGASPDSGNAGSQADPAGGTAQ
jgi:RND family efflux transporter MFP subunit